MKSDFKSVVEENTRAKYWDSFKESIFYVWTRLITEARYRISSSVSISIAVHLLVLAGYLSMSALDTVVEPPIREISFIDLTEVEKKPENVIKKSSPPPAVSRPVETQPEEQPEIATAGSPAPITLGNDRIFLDSRRKQAPINVNQIESVDKNVAQTKDDFLQVSPAIGVKRDENVSKPKALDLGQNREMLIASTQQTSGAFPIAQTGKPQIDLSPGQVVTGSTESMTSDFGAAPPVQKKDTPELKPQETQTIITGVLANRKILKKVIPPFPRWAKMQGISATISLNFTVMENGVVKENVIVNRTSGSLQWDKIVIAALKNWQFVPLDKRGVREDQSGVITFQFIL
jgi:TonB family protein